MSSRPSFQKRQKEQARKEKQRLKAERKQQRKTDRDNPQLSESSDIVSEDGADGADGSDVAVEEESSSQPQS